MRVFAAILTVFLCSCASIGAPTEPYLGPVLPSESEMVQLAKNSDFQRGVADARANILRNNLELRSYGLIIAGSKSTYELRRERILAKHHVAFVNPGCDFPILEEAQGYAYTIGKEIIDRYGSDFWQRVDTEARSGPVSAP